MIKKIKSNENIIRSTSDRDEMLLDATKYYGKFLDSLGFDWKHDPNMMVWCFKEILRCNLLVVIMQFRLLELPI